MQVKFVTVDVFTDRQFGGNPLAVVVDGTELSTRQMQAIATEFNLAETTFVLPPEKPESTARVRIFTPRAELPFAGHPTVGTADRVGRPSLLMASAHKSAGTETANYIGGKCMPMMEGVLDLI